MESSEKLKYVDEIDKSFGLAGMAISLMIWDAEEWLEEIDLDAAPDEAMHMSAEFYLNIAPRIGAKALWEQSLKRFQLTTAMLVANVTCRELTHRKHAQLPSAVDSVLRAMLTDEGASLCDLEDDEVSRIYGKSLAYCTRVFGHPGVCRLAEQLASTMRSSRQMSASEIWTILEPLNRL